MKIVLEGKTLTSEALNAEVIANENARNVWEAYDNAKTYFRGNKVSYHGSSYVNLVSCMGIIPTTSTTNWLCIAAAAGGGEVDASQVLITDTGNYYPTDDVNSALQEVGKRIGTLPSLTTESNTDLVGAINEVNSEKVTKGEIIIDVKDYGAEGDGTTDDTTAINSALTALADLGGGILYFPVGRYIVSSTIHVWKGASKNVTIVGSGRWTTLIQRATTFLTGDIFLMDVADGEGAQAHFRDLRIENAPISSGTYLNNSSDYAFHIKDTASNPVTIENVWIENGYGGIWIDNSAIVTLDKVFYLQTSVYAALFRSNNGIYITGHSNTNFISNCDFYCQDVDASYALYNGLLIYGCDGLQVSNCAFNGLNGIAISGGNSTNIDDIYFDNCIIDNVSRSCIKIEGTNAPYVYTNIRFSACHINAGNHTGGQDAIQFTGDADNVIINACNIGLCMGHGILITNSLSYTGGTKKSVLITNNIISDCNLANIANQHGITLGTGVGNVSIIGNRIYNETSSGYQHYGIALNGNNTQVIITDNNLTDNLDGTLYVGSGVNVSLNNNIGIDNIRSTIASADAITPPLCKLICVTGTTSINTINGGWEGREIRLFADNGDIILGVAGNILGGTTMNQYKVVRLIYSGTSWLIG